MADFRYIKDLANEQSFISQHTRGCDGCKFCFTSTETSIYSRRCSMTGAYCSKRPNIQRKRKQLHEDGQITAFVVMNFSDMSDVVYKWRIKAFIESLTKYLYFISDKKGCIVVPMRSMRRSE